MSANWSVGSSSMVVWTAAADVVEGGDVGVGGGSGARKLEVVAAVEVVES